MTLFIILICLGLQRLLNLSSHWAQPCLNTYVAFIAKWQTKDRILAVFTVIISLAIIVGLIEYALQNIWFNSLDFLFQGIVLFFCLNACSLKKRLADYFRARQQDDLQTAFDYGLDFLGPTPAHDLVTLTRAITERIFWQADVYLFSVLFWYIILGPVAAVIYATTRFLAVSETVRFYTASAQKIHDILDWIPARLTALSYALAGHFAYAFSHIRQYFLAGLASSHDLPFQAGLAAMECDKNDVALADLEENKTALELVDRSLVIWLGVIALFTIAAWVA